MQISQAKDVSSMKNWSSERTENVLSNDDVLTDPLSVSAFGDSAKRKIKTDVELIWMRVRWQKEMEGGEVFKRYTESTGLWHDYFSFLYKLTIHLGTFVTATISVRAQRILASSELGETPVIFKWFI